MKSIKSFEEKKLENSNFINGGDKATSYSYSNGSSGSDTICDNDGNGPDKGDTIMFDNGDTGVLS